MFAKYILVSGESKQTKRTGEYFPKVHHTHPGGGAAVGADVGAYVTPNAIVGGSGEDVGAAVSFAPRVGAAVGMFVSFNNCRRLFPPLVVA